MQLFILDRDPERCAQMLCDQHLRKMCLENAQILSGIIFLLRLQPSPGMPRPYSITHPVIRALNTQFKINWVLKLNHALHNEYFYRFQRFHLYAKYSSTYDDLLFAPADREDWSFAKVFKDFQTQAADIVAAYRDYYRFKKTQLRRWHYTERKEPEWLSTPVPEKSTAASISTHKTANLPTGR